MEYKIGQKVIVNGYEAEVCAIKRTTWEDEHHTIDYGIAYVVIFTVDETEIIRTVSQKTLDSCQIQLPARGKKLQPLVM